MENNVCCRCGNSFADSKKLQAQNNFGRCNGFKVGMSGQKEDLCWTSETNFALDNGHNKTLVDVDVRPNPRHHFPSFHNDFFRKECVSLINDNDSESSEVSVQSLTSPPCFEFEGFEDGFLVDSNDSPDQSTVAVGDDDESSMCPFTANDISAEYQQSNNTNDDYLGRNSHLFQQYPMFQQEDQQENNTQADNPSLVFNCLTK